MNGRLLSDKGISEAIREGLLEISGLTLTPESVSKKKSPVQASSLDLTIGRAFEPPIEKFNVSNLDHCDPRYQTGVKILPGHSAIIETKEVLRLSADISAFCFPPARLARQALLMTNPGHVDPGYHGKLTFTVINLGREEIYINRGMAIATLLIFRFDESDVASDYCARNGVRADEDERSVKKREDEAKVLNTLSPDFGNFQKRVELAARDAVAKKTISLEWAKLWVPAVSGAVAAVFVFLAAQFADLSGFATEKGVKNTIAPISKLLGDMENRLIVVETERGVRDLSTEVQKLRTDLDQLRSHLAQISK